MKSRGPNFAAAYVEPMNSEHGEPTHTPSSPDPGRSNSRSATSISTFRRLWLSLLLTGVAAVLILIFLLTKSPEIVWSPLSTAIAFFSCTVGVFFFYATGCAFVIHWCLKGISGSRPIRATLRTLATVTSIFALLVPTLAFIPFILLGLGAYAPEIDVIDGETYFNTSPDIFLNGQKPEYHRSIGYIFMEREQSYPRIDSAEAAEATDADENPNSDAGDGAQYGPESTDAVPPEPAVESVECSSLPSGPFDASTMSFDFEATNSSGERFALISVEPPCLNRIDENGAFTPLTGINTTAEPYALEAPGHFLVFGLGNSTGGETYVSADGGETWVESTFPDDLPDDLGAEGPLFLQTARVEKSSHGEVLILEMGHPRWVQVSKTVEVESFDGGHTFNRRG